jgi:uncharacterized protein (TIGR00375 family)
MRQIADFHLHSKYSRAVSPKMVLEEIDKWARYKGIGIISVPDFTHPVWFQEIKEKLEPAEPGLYRLKSNPRESKETRFILATEISCIYSKNGKSRRIHIVIFAPSLEVAEKINTKLGWIGNLKSDGRPILGLDAKELLKIVLDVSPDCLVVPAHIWTPWFSLFGSKSGFNTVEECFDEYSKYIYAVETGLSSDPAMNWRIKELDNRTIISSSDSHSLSHIGREACVFEIEPEKLSYNEITRIIKEKDREKFLFTVEFFPEEGMYHFDGHRNCKLRFSPSETKGHEGICPVCGRPVTVGVMSRVDELADPARPEGFELKNAVPFKSLIPLEEIIAEALDVGVKAKSVEKEYENIISKGENEFKILLDSTETELAKITLPKIVEGIMRVRRKELFILPGYDGEYGIVKIFSEQEKIKPLVAQKTLFE